MNQSQIDIRVVAKDIASDVLKGIRGDIDNLAKSTHSANSSSSVLTGTIAGLTTALTTFGLSIITSGIDQLVGFFNNAVDSAVEFEKTMTTLSIVAPRFGVSAEEATKAAEELGKELRIGVGPAAESLQNLLKSGLNLNQARELLKRFTNEAITGKSKNISLAQAVQNLSFAYQTANPALGNLSGISENYGVIIENGRKALIAQGVAVKDITEDMAKYEGMIQHTNLTLGSAEKFTGSYIDKQATLNLKWEEFQKNIGTLLLPILADVLDVLTKLFDEISPKLENWASVLIPEIGRIFKEDIVPWIEQFISYLGSEQFKKDLENIKQLFVDIKNIIVSIVQGIKDIQNSDLVKLNNSIQNQASKSSTLEKFTPLPALRGLGILPQYANGTDYHSGGAAIVGENGPEIVNLPKGSSVTPNSKLNPSNITNNFYGYTAEQISSQINRQLKLGY